MNELIKSTLISSDVMFMVLVAVDVLLITVAVLLGNITQTLCSMFNRKQCWDDDTTKQLVNIENIAVMLLFAFIILSIYLVTIY